MLETQGVEFLRDPQCLKSDFVQGRPPDVPTPKLCHGPVLAGVGAEASRVRLGMPSSSQKHVGEMTDQLGFILCPALVPFFLLETQADARRWSSVPW